MKIRLWVYIFKNAFRSLTDNKALNLISIGTMTISLLIFSSFQLVSVNLYNWVQDWGESQSMSIYLKNEIDNKEVEAIKCRVEQMSGVKIERYIPKEDALILLSQALGTQ